MTSARERGRRDPGCREGNPDALGGPEAAAPAVRAAEGRVEGVVATKAPGDATELELHIREVNAGLYAFDARELFSALEQVGTENAQGELYLRTCCRSCAGTSGPWSPRSSATPMS